MEEYTFTFKITRRQVLWFALLAYVMGIIYVKFFLYDYYYPTPMYNWVPSVPDNSERVIYSSIFNFVVFLPLGACIGFRGKGRLFQFGLAILACFAMELLQPLFEAGIFDINTVIVNSLGVSMGYILFKLVKPAIPFRGEANG